MKSVPEEAIDTMLHSLAPSTIKQYNVSLKLWWQFCQNEGISPFSGKVPDVLRFFQTLLNSTKNVYGSFNSHRAAVSLITSTELGTDPQIKRFMKGVFRKRPPKPKYESTWDPQQVLRFLEENEDSSLKTLSKKLVTLLALATGQRIQTLSLIRCANIRCTEVGIKIFIQDLIKTSRVNASQPCLEIQYFSQIPKLCVATCIKKYLSITRNFRTSDNDLFFLTYKTPNGPATKQTLSRWIKDTLREAGVDTSIFKAHSTRHASTSAAWRNGTSYDTIRTSAGWSRESTFARFYNRPLLQSDSFLERVFQSNK